ncbi:MAG: putative baseplate assembly protein [Anaerolineae bacterium]|nr:putative baseplate assembly protein [Anaerolineae bacterium]
MPLPMPNLDDLRFQRDLVDEARRRIIRYCPEWTDYNLSDPGITLIELFAWMTELLVYRLNRVPEKSHLHFLELLGAQLQPATSAQTSLVFQLSAPFPLVPGDTTETVVPRGTEVATWSAGEESEVVFTTDRALTIAPVQLTQLRREGDYRQNYLSQLGVRDFHIFGQDRPEEGDAFYIGIGPDVDISGYILRLEFEARETEAPGINRDDPPLVWECSVGNDRWEKTPPSRERGGDTTGGLNNPRGSLVLELPLSAQPDLVHGQRAYWIRCRYESQRPEEQGRYTVQSPRLRAITPYVLGAAVPATHAQFVLAETLGRSSGDPGQAFRLLHAPVLSPIDGETIQVEEERDGEPVWIDWARVSDFAASERYDRHFTLDESTGEVAFGPCVIRPDGTTQQYGRVPEANRLIRISRYRHGGGVQGNVPAGKLQVLRSAIPYIDRVMNPRRATGGRDQESLEEAKLRATRIVRAQQRAVTAEDFEAFAVEASRRVARAKCIGGGEMDRPTPDVALPPGTVDLLIVPAAFDALQAGSLAERDLRALVVDQSLRQTVRAYLDRYRLLTTTVNVREPRYLAVRVSVQVVASEQARQGQVVPRITELLRLHISPLALESQDRRIADIIGPKREGWPFGGDIYVAELFSLIQQVPGVRHVLDVRVGSAPLVPARAAPSAARDTKDGAAPERIPLSDERIIRVPGDALVCLTDCEVEVVSL